MHSNSDANINLLCSNRQSNSTGKCDKFEENWHKITLSENILEGLQTIGFLSPTPIQAAVIPQAMRHKKDIIGAAETGSGKTLAFAIPILESWLNEGRQNLSKDEVKLFAIVITPTRELAIQVKEVLKQLSLSAKIKPRQMYPIAIVGGMSEQKQQRLLKSKPDVVVATPGRLWALQQTGDEHLEDLSELRILVVDEIDRMLEQGHFEELRHIIHDVHRYKKERQMGSSIMTLEGTDEKIMQSEFPPLQTLIFSATLTFANQIPLRTGEKAGKIHGKLVDPAQKVRRIAQSMCMRKGSNRLAVIDLTPDQKTPKTLIECRMNCIDLLEKDTNLFYLLRRYSGRTLVFGNSVSAIHRLQALLRKLISHDGGPIPRILHGRMKEKDRLKSMENFQAFDNSILLATDVAARGLDFQDVQNIIHYQAPKTTENYIHRSGRTARAKKAGLSVLFVDTVDLNHYLKICRNMNKDEDLEVLRVDDEQLMANCRQVVQLAIEAESIEHRLRKRKSREQWFERIAKQADLAWDEQEGRTKELDDGDEIGKEEEMCRRKKFLEKNLKEKLKTVFPTTNNQQQEHTLGINGVDEIRKRIRLERGGKKWFKRTKRKEAH